MPHADLLPRCAVAIHHGGVGTVIAAIRAKLPQLLIPLAFDQPFWGRRLQELGVGDSHDLEDLSVPSLAKKLRALLAESVSQQVQQLASKLEEQDGRDMALDEILHMIQSSGSSLPLPGALPSASCQSRTALRQRCLPPTCFSPLEIGGRPVEKPKQLNAIQPVIEMRTLRTGSL